MPKRLPEGTTPSFPPTESGTYTTTVGSVFEKEGKSLDAYVEHHKEGDRTTHLKIHIGGAGGHHEPHIEEWSPAGWKTMQKKLEPHEVKKALQNLLYSLETTEVPLPRHQQMVEKTGELVRQHPLFRVQRPGI